MIWETIGYTPTPDQWTAHERKNVKGEVCRQVALEGGFQSGKTTWVAAEIVSLLPWLAGRECWFLGPDYEQSRRELEQIRDWAKVLGIWSSKPQHVSMPMADAMPWRFLLKNGTLCRNYTAANYRKAAGATPGAVILTEPGQIVDGEAFILMLLRAGLDAVPLYLVGTLEGSENWYAELTARWESGAVPGKTAFKLPTWGNTHLFPGGRHDPKIELIENDPDVPRARFLERYAGERTAPPGLVFGPTAHHPGFVKGPGTPQTHVRPIRLGSAPEGRPADDPTIYLDPTTPLELWIDWGFDHPYAVLLVAVWGDPKSIAVLDDCVIQGINTVALIALVKERWATVWPRIHRLILDPATNQHHDGPKTTREYWIAGTGLRTWADTRVGINESTDRIRRLLEVHPFLQRPRLVVDPQCRHLIDEFTRGYRNRLDTRGASTGIPIPLHDDAVKCIHYGSYVHFPGMVDRSRKHKRSYRKALPFA